MRKRLVILLIIIAFLCSSCNNVKENKMIKFETGIYYDKSWEEQVGTYQDDVIPDKDSAVAIATQIFNGMRKSPASQEYTPQSVFYDEVDEIWIVSFWKNADSATVGGDCNIAIQKKDGKILRIWFGE